MKRKLFGTHAVLFPVDLVLSSQYQGFGGQPICNMKETSYYKLNCKYLHEKVCHKVESMKYHHEYN